MNNTGRNCSFSAAKRIKIGAHLSCGTGVQRLGRFTRKWDRRKGTHKSLPTPIILFNPSEDIEREREREREIFLMKQFRQPDISGIEVPTFRALASNEQTCCIPDTCQKLFDLVLRSAGILNCALPKRVRAASVGFKGAPD